MGATRAVRAVVQRVPWCHGCHGQAYSLARGNTWGPVGLRLKGGAMGKTCRRYNEPGHAHELTFSCYRRLPLLSKDRTRQWFLDALDRARKLHSFDLWAFVVMPEHAHVLLMPRPNTYDISAVLKSIKQPVARRATEFIAANAPGFLERLRIVRPNGKTEYRFWQQGGGYDRNIVKPATAWIAVRYLHDNPVRRGLVTCATDWPWSSARCYAGMDNALLKVDGSPPDTVA
jgi:putative transposase